MNQQQSDLFNIDTIVLADLAEDVSIELMPNLVDVFLTELDTRITTIQNAHFDSERKKVRIQVHSIKSCARTFGATALANKAAEIEQMIDAGTTHVEKQLQQLVALLPAVKQAFNYYQASLTTI